MPNPRPPRKRPTLRELSALTGLSQAGVSYALRGERVSPATARRVQEEAERIGFRTDPIARALRGGRTHLVGVIGGSLADLWHQEFVAHLQRALGEHDLRLVLADAGGDADAELELARDLTARRVDGLIVVPVDPRSPGWREVCAATPTVSVGSSPSGAGAVRFAAGAGIRLALDHLTELGHRRILALGAGPHRVPRRTGVERRRCGFSVEEAGEAALDALRAPRRPTAVFALSDTTAYGVYDAARSLGLRVPGQLSVVGFDDHPVSRLLDPPLTTIAWDTPAAARAAADVLVRLIGHEVEERPVVVAPTLLVRGSTASPV